MRSLMIILIVVTSIFSVFSETIEFKSTALEGLSAIDKSSSKMCDDIDKNIKKGVKISQFGFTDLINAVTPTFDSMDIDAINARIQFSKNDFGNSGVEWVNESAFISLASDFIEKLPYPISMLENIKVLYVKYERSIEEKGQTGKFGAKRTHTTVIKFGRMLHNLPVFNSYATVGFNAVDHSVKYFDLKNWVPVDVVPVADFQKKMDKNAIERAIRNKAQTLLNKESQFKKVTIEGILFGWQIIDHRKVTPAVIFHGDIFENDEQKKGEKFSSLEIL